MKLTLVLNTFLVFFASFYFVVFAVPYDSPDNGSVPQVDTSPMASAKPHQDSHTYTAPAVVNETNTSHCQPSHPHWIPSQSGSEHGPVAVPLNTAFSTALSTGALIVGVAAAMVLL